MRVAIPRESGNNLGPLVGERGIAVVECASQIRASMAGAANTSPSSAMEAVRLTALGDDL